MAVNDKRHGFTFAELLLVIIIVGVVILLVGGLAASLARLRDADARTKCANNLKQFGLGFHNFESTFKRLPPLFGGGTDAKGQPVAVLSKKFPTMNGPTHYLIIPYVESNPFWGQSRLTVEKHDVFVPSLPLFPMQTNQRPMATYVCPADPGMRDGIQLGSGLGGSSYLVNGQLFGNTDPATGLPLDDMPWDRGSTIAGIKDGSSNTIAFAHGYTRCGAAEGTPTTAASGAVWGYYNNGLAPAGTQGPPIFMNAVISGPANVGPNIKTHFQMSPAPFTTDPANGRGCDPALPATPHSGAMIVLLADGSTRSLTSSLSLTTWWLACSPDDGQKMPEDW